MNALLFRVGVLSLALLYCACFSYAQIDCFYKTLSVSRVQGRVFDQLGQPISGAMILLKQDRKEMSRATTDADGRFSIKVADGKYELHADAQGFAPTFAYINVGNHLAHAFHPSKLWLMLAVGAGGPCPANTTNHRQFVEALGEYKNQTQGPVQTHATQK
jgi:hypothetical protein